LLSGEGAGQFAAASGVVSDLINLAKRSRDDAENFIGNNYTETPGLSMRKIDRISTRFYLRFMAMDKPGVLSQISGVLGKHGISINSVSQKEQNKTSAVPVIMLTHCAPEEKLRLALDEIYKQSIVKSKPVAIRIENL